MSVENGKTIDIALATDDNYAFLLATALRSLIDNNSQCELFRVHILDNHLSVKNKSLILQSFPEKNVYIHFYEVESLLQSLHAKGVKGYKDIHNLSTYARLFLPELLPQEIHRVLYLDCDILVLGNLLPLFQMHLDQVPVAGAVDPCLLDYKEKSIGLQREAHYINAGVLLIYLDFWRENRCSQKALNLAEQAQGTYSYHDQDILNLLFDGTIEIVPQKYNTLHWEKLLGYGGLKAQWKDRISEIGTKESIKEACRAPVILHYAGCDPDRPWNGGALLRKKWFSYFEKTAFVKEISFPYHKYPGIKQVLREMTIRLRLFGILHWISRKLHSKQ